MIELQDRMLPADMIGLDEPSEYVDVIIPADHPLSNHIRIMIDGRQKAESMVSMINLSARYLLRYMRDRSVKRATNVLSDPRHIPRTQLVLDEDGNPKIKRVEFKSVVIAVAPTVGVNLIPKPWLPWVVHPCLNSRGNFIGTTTLPIFDGDEDDDIQAVMPNTRSGEDNFAREIERRIEEMREASRQQRAYGGPPLSISGLQEEYQRHIEAMRSRSNSQGGGVTRELGRALGGPLGGAQSGPPGDNQASSAGQRMRQALQQAGRERDQRIIINSRRLGNSAVIRDMHGNTIHFASQGEVGPAGQQGPVGADGVMASSSAAPSRINISHIMPAMRMMEQIEEEVRQMNVEFNDLESFHAQRLAEAREDLSSLRSVWGLESSFAPSPEEEDITGEPARQFGVAEGVNLGDIVRGPGGVAIGIVTGSRTQYDPAGVMIQHIQVRNDQGEFDMDSRMVNRNGDSLSIEISERVAREIQSMPIPPQVRTTIMEDGESMSFSLRSPGSPNSSSSSSSSRPGPGRQYVRGEQVDWTLINLQIFDTVGQIWLHLDTWAHCLTPVTSIRRFGQFGRVMQEHANNLTTRNWTERCREMTGTLNRFSNFVHRFLMHLSEATGSDMDSPMCTPEAFSLREGLLMITRGHSPSGCRTDVYDYLYTNFLEADARTTVGQASVPSENDVQREWEAQMPIHAEDEDDFPF